MSIVTTSFSKSSFFGLRVVSLLLSPSSETRKKPARKKISAQDPGGEKHGHFSLAGLSKNVDNRRVLYLLSFRADIHCLLSYED